MAATPLIIHGGGGQGKGGYHYFDSSLALDAALDVDEGQTIVIDGDLTIGSALTPITDDAICLQVHEGGRLIVTGGLTVYRDVAAATLPLVSAYDAGAVMEVHGETTLVDVGGGTSVNQTALEVIYGAKVKFVGDISITSDCATLASVISVQDSGQLECLGAVVIDANPGAGATSYAITVNDESTFGIGGNLTITFDGTLTNTTGVVTVSKCSELTVLGNTTLNTEAIVVVAPILGVWQGSKVNLTGNVLFDCDAATGQMFVVDDESLFHIHGGDLDIQCDSAQLIRISGNSSFSHDGVFDLLVMGTGTGDGSVMMVLEGSTVRLDQVLFDSGSDLDCGGFATFLIQDGSEIHVTDTTGASDALNTNNVAAAMGMILSHGAQAYLPAWGAGTGIGANSVNGLDAQVGGAAAADWAGAGDVANAAELCLASLVA